MLPQRHRGEVDADNRRRRGRFVTETLSCEWGRIIDLSATGMRVLHRGRLRLSQGEAATLTLQQDQTRVPIDCRVVWIKRQGWRSQQIGVTFRELPEATRQAIAALAHSAAVICSHPSMYRIGPAID